MAAIGRVLKVTANKTSLANYLANLLKNASYFSGTKVHNLSLHTSSQACSLTSVLYQRSPSASNAAGTTGGGGKPSTSASLPSSQPEPIATLPQQQISCQNAYDPVLVQELLNKMKDDTPLSDMPDPFAKDYHRCFLCRQDVQLDYKNVRLLSQFISPYTGRIYGRAVTGLCIPMQKHVSRLIKRSRRSGYMSYMFKDPKYSQDPQPYDKMAKK